MDMDTIPHMGQPGFAAKDDMVVLRRELLAGKQILTTRVQYDHHADRFGSKRIRAVPRRHRPRKRQKGASHKGDICYRIQLLPGVIQITKASRDVTNISKKTIFLLHRIVLEDSSDDHTLALRAASSGREKLSEANAIFAVMRPELVGDRFWRYHRQVSPGLQEYIEALSFAHYLEHGSLISYQQVQDALGDADGPVRSPYLFRVHR